MNFFNDRELLQPDIPLQHHKFLQRDCSLQRYCFNVVVDTLTSSSGSIERQLHHFRELVCSSLKLFCLGSFQFIGGKHQSFWLRLAPVVLVAVAQSFLCGSTGVLVQQQRVWQLCRYINNHFLHVFLNGGVGVVRVWCRRRCRRRRRRRRRRVGVGAERSTSRSAIRNSSSSSKLQLRSNSQYQRLLQDGSRSRSSLQQFLRADLKQKGYCMKVSSLRKFEETKLKVKPEIPKKVFRFFIVNPVN